VGQEEFFHSFLPPAGCANVVGRSAPRAAPSLSATKKTPVGVEKEKSKLTLARLDGLPSQS